MAGIIPAAYEGREQSFLKHRILRDYLIAWGMKLGSRARYEPTVLHYVDCFAGPWQAKDEELQDTSVAIGLSALREAVQHWAAQQGHALRAEAIFVERAARAHQRLRAFVESQASEDVGAIAYRGTFEQHATRIAGMLGTGPAFIFVDPTGWKGAGMQHIAKVARHPRRDVLVNLMFHHVNRFKDDPRKFLRDQMRDFFGLGERELPADLDEEGLVALYRDNLQERCALRYVADLAVPHPTRAQTFFRLVVGGGHPQVVQLFRDVESRVCGDLAGVVREEAKRRKAQADGQLDLGLPTPTLVDRSHVERHQHDLAAARRRLLDILAKGPRRFADVWGEILQVHHVTRGDLAVLVEELVEAGALGRQPGRGGRGVRDSDLLCPRDP